MVDLTKPIFMMLKHIADVDSEFPSTEAVFPRITISEIVNIEAMSVEGAERLSDITYQIDVWDNGPSRQNCERIAGEVSKIMLANHYKRILGRGFTDPSGLHRKMMQFSINIFNL